MCDANRLEIKTNLAQSFSITCGWCWSTIHINAHCDDAATDELVSLGWNNAEDDQQIGIACPSCLKAFGLTKVSYREGE